MFDFLEAKLKENHEVSAKNSKRVLSKKKGAELSLSFQRHWHTQPQISEPTPIGREHLTYHLVVVKTPIF